jgi:hypothetical protein
MDTATSSKVSRHQSLSSPELGKVTLKINGDEALSDESVKKSNGDKALNRRFFFRINGDEAFNAV